MAARSNTSNTQPTTIPAIDPPLRDDLLSEVVEHPSVVEEQSGSESESFEVMVTMFSSAP
jgi:hypothetical protein